MNIWKRSIAGLMLSTATTFASAAVIDFEGFDAGTVMNTQYAGVTIEGTNIQRETNKNMAVVFDSYTYTGGDDDLEAPFYSSRSDEHNDINPYNPGNILILHENPNTCNDAHTVCENPDDEGRRPAGFFEFNFDQLVTINSIEFFDVEGAETLPNAIQFFDTDGTQIGGNFYSPDTGGDNLWASVSFGVEGVSKMVINMGGSGAIDNIDYTVSVSEPGTFALLGLGLLGLGAARRKQAK